MPETDSPRSGRRSARTQAQRTERTRTLLLDATIDCLVDLGYARTSINEICKRAGVSRGAQQHHFSTRAELMAEAIAHLTSKLGEEFLGRLRHAPAAPTADRVGTGIELLWQAYSGKLSVAVMELWVAARTDRELRDAMRPVDRALGRSTLRAYLDLAGVGKPSERVELLFWLTVNLTRGLALDAEIGGDDTRRAALLAEWKRIAATQLADVTPSDPA